MVISVLAAASGAAKFLPAAVGAVSSASKFIPAAAAAASSAAKFVPAAASAAHSAVKLVPAAIKFVPIVGTAAVGIGKLTATITAAVTTATALIGIGKLTIIPILIASLAYYNYDLFDPENRPFNVKQIDREYDFIIVGGGSAGSVLANRLSEISSWKILLLEAGGHETEITDVPILSLYLHKSKLDWKYR